MNANQIKLSMSRNSKRALVANLSVNDEEIFATSHGHLLACALHLIGAEAVDASDSESPRPIRAKVTAATAIFLPLSTSSPAHLHKNIANSQFPD